MVQLAIANFSPDEALILTASFDKTVKQWDSQTGENTLTLIGHQTVVQAAVFSPDRTTGECTITLRDHSDHLCTANFSIDGSMVFI